MSDFYQQLKLFFIPCQANNYKPRFLDSKFLFYYAVILLFLKLLIIPVFLYFPNTVFFADITKIDLINLANNTRAYFKLTPLKENPLLNEAAYLKAKDMLEKGYFAHYSPEGLSPWYWLQKIGYQYRSAGENLAIGFVDSEQVHQAWLNSPSHKQNIINPKYQEIGIAVLKGKFQGSETTLVVQYFGSSASLASAPKTATRETTSTQEAAPTKETPSIKEEILVEKETATTQEEVVKEEQKEEQTATTVTVLTTTEEVAATSKTAPRELVSAATAEKFEKTPAFLFFEFMTGPYYDLIQKIIYGSLLLIVCLLLVTVFYDIFIYRRFEIQYKDVILKTVGFAALWFILFFLDKTIIIQLIAYNFRIG
ncbi:MAG: CAP domain-containing protein [Minisyncoccales bacterium]